METHIKSITKVGICMYKSICVQIKVKQEVIDVEVERDRKIHRRLEKDKQQQQSTLPGSIANTTAPFLI